MMLILLLIFLVVFLIDFLPMFYTWQSRIKIGRFSDDNMWKKKVLNLSRKWLASTPVIKMKDNERLIAIDLLQGNYKKDSIQSWQEAALVLGLTEQATNTKDEQTKLVLKQFFDSKISSSGNWKQAPTESDHAIFAYALLNAVFLDHAKYRSALDETYEMLLSLRGADGTVAYKSHNQRYRYVDTVGFICPFLVQYGLAFNKPEAVDLGVRQITEYEKYGMMRHENIPCHTYRAHDLLPAGLFGWGRGLGWFVTGLADSWNALPASHPHKKTLEEIIVKTVRSSVKFQRENGSYSWQLLVPESRADSSTVATLCWFFSVAGQIPEISTECNAAKEKGLNYLRQVTRRNGAVDFSQGDTMGIGMYSRAFDIMPFTQGFVLRTLFANHEHKTDQS